MGSRWRWHLSWKGTALFMPSITALIVADVHWHVPLGIAFLAAYAVTNIVGCVEDWRGWS